MSERRRHTRVAVDFWVSLTHPLMGVMTGNVQDMSVGGMLVVLDENIGVFTMMEMEARIHGEGWDDSNPPIPVQVARVNDREIGLRFIGKVAESQLARILGGGTDFDFTSEYRSFTARSGMKWVG